MVQQVSDLASARCRFGKFLRVAVNGRAPDVSRLLRDFPAIREETEHGELVRGLEVRLSVHCESQDMRVGVDLRLGDQAVFYPSDAALASWMAQSDQGKAVIVYE